jgi:hypothetical protein
MEQILPPESTPKYNTIIGFDETRKSVIRMKCANIECNQTLTRHKSLVTKHSVLTCSRACRKSSYVLEKIEEMNTIKGNINPFRTKEGQRKARDRVRDIYGVDNVFKSEEIKTKIKKTCKDRYGADNPMKSPVIQQKALTTRVERYGIENLTGAVVTSKAKATNLRKYGSEWFFASETGRMTRDNLKSRYGYCDEDVDKMFKSKGITIENLTNKYGCRDIANTVYSNWKEKCKHTEETFVQRYGPERGSSLYNEYRQKMAECRYTRRSKISDEFISSLNETLPSDMVGEAYFMDREYFIPFRDSNSDFHIYFVDYKYKNKIIEFYGDIWHGNPDKYSPEEVNPITKIKYKYILEKDIIRINNIKSMGFEVFIIWEAEYRKDKTYCINKAKRFILQDN